MKHESQREPRGIRNHNPGNIRKGSEWKGLAAEQPDVSFCSFSSPKYGIRAIGRILLNYERRHHLSTVRGIINRWAPPVENNTDAYVEHVATQLGVDPDLCIPVQYRLAELVIAIIEYENGYNPYDHKTILQGVEMAMA